MSEPTPVVRRRPSPPQPSQPTATPTPASDAPAPDSWDEAAEWYDEHLRSGDTHHQHVLGPGVVALLEGFKSGGSVLDIACGTGYFCRLLAARRWRPTGVDVADAMLDQARKQGPGTVTYVRDNAETLGQVRGEFDAAISVMAIQNMRQPDRMLHAVAAKLRIGSPLVIVTVHPAFRIPRNSDWGWDAYRQVQFRRIDVYMSHQEIPIQTHPGSNPNERTMTYHRPLSFYVNAISNAGFRLDRMEEWCSHRYSDSGPRARAENVAREEFPMFLALRAIRTK